MILHPLWLTVLLADLLSALVLAYALYHSIRVLLHWRADSASALQTGLEARQESLRMALRFLLGLQGIGVLAWLWGVARVWPDMVPGAMCGTGVIQASSGHGEKVLVFRGILLLLLTAYAELDRLDHTRPLAPLTVPKAHLVPLLVPFFLLAAHHVLAMALSMTTHEPVSCCSVVYDHFPGVNRAATGLSPDGMLLAFLAATMAVFVSCIPAWRRPLGRGVWACVLTAPSFAVIAAFTETRLFSAYHYGVLHHECPWCLFLPQHHGLGFLFWGTLAGLGILAVKLGVNRKLAGRDAAFQEAAAERIRRLSLGIVVLTLLVLAMTLGPMLYWRFSTGLWMHETDWLP